VAINIQEQQQQIYKLEAELANLKKEKSRLENLSKGGLVKKPDLFSIQGQQLLADIATYTTQITEKENQLKALNKTLKQAKTEISSVPEVGTAEELRLAALAGFQPNQIQEYRNYLAKVAKDKKDKKAAKEAVEKGEVQSQELTAELANAGKVLAQDLGEQERIDLATQLNKVYGLNLPLNGKYSPALKSAYIKMLADKFERSLDEGKTLSVQDFLTIGTLEGTYREAGAGAGGPEVSVLISSPTQAASYIQSTFKTVLNREATADEVDTLSKALKKAEKSAGRRSVKVGGRTEYTSDLDRVQFLTEEIKKIKDPKTGKSEFETKRGEKESITSQDLASVARLNGINLNQDQLNSYLTDVRNGKDINVIKNDIRYMAGLGRPDSVKKLLAEGTNLDTIYSPYKKTMATLLELDPNSIDINDTTLQGAITDRELPIYEFRRLLKKDPRWQYTNNAREEVSNKVLRVLRDFGFQG